MPQKSKHALKVEVARPTSRPLLLQPVVVPRASEILAADLRRRILEGELKEESVLPPERTLVDQTRLSRAIVREALQILELQGLIVTRPGRSGGSAITRPDVTHVSASLESFIWGRRLGVTQLIEVREVIEPLAAALAAERRSDAQLAELRRRQDALSNSIEDLPRYIVENLAWHLVVAEASQNELISAFMNVVSPLIDRQTHSKAFDSIEIRTGAARAHERITDAIAEHDSETARRRMGRHVVAFRDVLPQLEREEADLYGGEPDRADRK